MSVLPQSVISLNCLQPPLLPQPLRPQPLDLIGEDIMVELQLEAVSVPLLFSFKFTHLFC